MSDAGSTDPDPAAAVDPEAGGDQTPWRRLSRRMLLVEPVKQAVRAIPAMAGVLIAGVAAGGLAWWVWPAVAVPIVLGLVAWAFTWYRVTEDSLQLRTGIVSRNVLTAHLARVRTVDVTASPLHRVLGIAAVKIGTGASTPFVLDGLPRHQAESLREALLHRGRAAPPPATGPEPAGSAAPPAGEETELASFRASWLRFAPFTLSGLVAVAAVVGFGAQFVDVVGKRIVGDVEHAAEDVVGGLAATSWWLLGTVGALLFLVVLTVLSVLMYAVSYGGYRLTRHRRGTLRLVRGLVTTRSTTVEERRVRGAVLEEPALLRLVRGGRARLLTTGLPGESGSGGSDLLVPPAPVALAGDVLEHVLRVAGVAAGPLRRHGAAAARRRWTRALLPAALVAAAASAAATWAGWPVPLRVAPAALVVLAVPVALGRARALGHAVVEGHLVGRQGVFPRRRHVLRLSGAIGWSWSSTPFQRRSGLVTCAALTAAGSGRVDVLDVPEGRAVELALGADPDLVAPFLATGDADAGERRDAPGSPRLASGHALR